jgi:DNA repair protein RAD5
MIGVVKIEGVLTDCPERLTTGVGLMVTIRIYLLAAAFRPLKSSNMRDDTIQFGFQEGLETEEERSRSLHVKCPNLTDFVNTLSALRGRKDAIVKLFDVLCLKPITGSNAKGKKLLKHLHKRIDKHSGKKVKEVVGDGEEIEVDDEEELSKNEIDSIYNRYNISMLPNNTDLGR